MTTKITFPKQRLLTVDAPAGSGKTHAAILWAVDEASDGECICFVQPTIALINETYLTLQRLTKGMQIQLERFHGEVRKADSVQLDIMQHLKSRRSDVGHIVLMTHQAFFNLSYFDRPSDWTVIIDEIPLVDYQFSKVLPNTHRILTQYLEPNEYDLRHFRLQKKATVSKKLLRDLAENKADDALIVSFQDLFHRIGSEHHLVLVNKETWARYETNNFSKRTPLTICSILQPTFFKKFRRTILMGAHFAKSLLKLYWSMLKIDFMEFQPISRSLRYTIHPNGDCLKVKYLFEGSRWSKSFYRKSVERNGLQRSAIALYYEFIQKEFQGQPFVYIANKGQETPFDTNTSIRLSGNPFGLNSYQHHDRFAFISALNPPPEYFRSLRALGITHSQIRVANMYERCY